MSQRFLFDSDYGDQIRTELRNLLDDSEGETKIKRAEQKAIAQMKMRLSGRYDVDRIFAPAESQDNDCRNAFVVMTAIDITLYHLWSKERGKVPNVRNDRYQDAIEWLKSVGNGEDITDLPTKVVADDDISPMAQIYSLHAPNDHKF